MQLRWITGIVWLIIGMPLMIVNIIGKPVLSLEPGPLSLMVGLMAVLLGVFRLWTARLLSRRRNPPPPPIRRDVGRTPEYNPELDFNRPDAPEN